MLKSEVWGSIIVVIMLAIISARFAPFTAAVDTVIIAGCTLRVLKKLEQIEQKLEEQKKTESAERPEE